MIPDQWYTILESSEVKHGRLVAVRRMGEQLVLWRDERGQVVCMRDQCPHRGVALSAGQLVNGCVECPFHGFQFDETGQCRIIPANGRHAPVPKAIRAQTYPTHEAHGFVAIWWGQPGDNLPSVPFFETIDDRFSYSTVRDRWATHYSRAIENQLDVVHLPFVHKTTIGRGGRTLVNGPLVRWEDDVVDSGRMNIWVYNRVDEGEPPLKADELPEPGRHPSLQFQFPNLWHNWISDDVHLVAAFAPIDDENTLLYIRFYQKFVRAPILRTLVNWAASPLNLIIERQDKRVVVTQRPKRSDLRIGEKLIPGDGPIIEYRRHRSDLIERARQSAERQTLKKETPQEF